MNYIFVFLALLATADAGIARKPRDTIDRPACRSSKCKYIAGRSRGDFMYEVNGHQLIIDFMDGKYFTLRCNSNSRESSMFSDDPDLPVMSWRLTVEEAKFDQCLIPSHTYNATLDAFNVKVTKTLKLVLPADSKLEAHHFQGLQITDLEISAIDSLRPPRPWSDFLDGIPGLQKLKLRDVVPEPEALIRLPTSLVILNIINAKLPAAERALRNGDNITPHWLERLTSLQSVHLVDSAKIVAESPGAVLTLPKLSSLPKLVNASLFYIPLDQKQLSNWLKNSTLKNLILKSCGLTNLPGSMFVGAQLTTIALPNNKLMDLPYELFTPLINTLRELDFSHNKLDKNNLLNSVRQLKLLETLIANDNPLRSLCGDPDYIKTPALSSLPASLHRLGLRNTGATRICLDWIRNGALMDIDLSYNNIEILTYEDLEMYRPNGSVRLNLTHNNKLRKIRVSRDNFDLCLKDINHSSVVKNDKTSLKRVPVELDLSRLECNCDAYWLREVLRTCPLLMLKSDVHCFPKNTSVYSTLLQFGPDEISCPYNGACLSGFTECSCTKRPRDNATIVSCFKGALPQPPLLPPAAKEYPLALHVGPKMLSAVPNTTLVELHAPNNNISMLDERDLTESLRVLDLRNNNISHISLKAAQVLSNQAALYKNLSVNLSGNPLACECDDAPTFSHLKLVVRDWNLMQCVDSSLVSGKTKADLCPSPLPMVFGIVFPILLITVAGLTFYLLLPRVKQFLFRHDLFVSWILRDEDDFDDSDKTHDVFLSYSNADLKQLQELKYGIEKLGYTTIEHQNDWQPGDAVLEQIANSVQKARRTLLLVTDNFAESEWTPVEFNFAHHHALKTRTKRVLIIHCGLKKYHKLPLDLRIYLENHTYLDWDSPKFWHLLRRFMPPPRQEVLQFGPDDLNPPSALMQQNLPLLEKFPQKPQLVIPQLSATIPSAC